MFFVLLWGFSAAFVNSQEILGWKGNGQYGFYKPECVNYLTGAPGRCVPYDRCTVAIVDERYHIKPQPCPHNATYDSNTICCSERFASFRSDYMQSYPTDDLCFIPQPVHRTPEDPALQETKAWQMCLKYQQARLTNGTDLVDKDKPRRKGRSISGRRVKRFGAGGVDAYQREFPHMALLGYGKEFSEAPYNCGGSLISDRFVLTAAHCQYSTGLGYVTFAVFGTLSSKQVPRIENVYDVKTIIKHPRYRPPEKYNDIALLEMDRQVKFDYWVLPACLHVGDPVDDSRAYATGWGILGPRRKRATILQNIPLWKIPDDICGRKFAHRRHLPNGIDVASQMCFGDDGTPRDTCEGDSGGPIQIKSRYIYCMYIILGVTSFGFTACGEVGYPGVYTRVSNYVPWIESIVWPDSVI